MIEDLLEDLAEDYYPYHEYSDIHRDHNLRKLKEAKAKLLEALESCKPEEMVALEFTTCEYHRKELQSGRQCFCEESVESWNKATQQYHSNIRKLFE